MRLADFIRQHAPDIMDGAEAFARTQSPAGVELSAKALRNHIPEILKAIVLDLSEDQSAQQQVAKAEGRAPVSTSGETAASIHGRMRAADGFDVNQMIAEYRALRASVLRLWIAEAPLTTDSVEDVIRFNEAIDQAIAESLARFNTEVESWRQVFLGALGHDLRGPLTAIVYSADRLSHTVQGTPHAKYVDRIVSGGARIHDLLDDLLVYTKSKLGAGMVISRDTCDLADALHEEVDLVRAALPDVTFCFRTDGPTDGRFDASRIREALHNLLTNAAKYGAAGEDVWVTVKGDADRVVATVCNMGEPLQEGALHGMFDPLRRGSSTAAVGEHTSLGLGLFIVREIVNAHGGEVTASSSNGKTEFTFSLPRHA